jgi:hypothetical protein
VATEPVSGTVNFRGNAVTLYFSEFVEKGSVLAALHLQPPKSWEASWDLWGRRLRLRFTEPLDSNTTYVLTLGSQWRDLAGNAAGEAVSIVFATGSVLARGEIRGRLLEERPEGVYILAYPLQGIAPDTLNPAHTPARYWTQAGSTGTFALQGLAPGEYRLFALRDADGDRLYTEGRDLLGTTMAPVWVGQDTPTTVLLRLNPAQDTEPPSLLDVRPQSRQRVQLLFSEPVDTAAVAASAFVVEDSTAALRLPLAAAYLVPGSATVVELLLEQPVADTTEVWFLRLVPGGVRDTAGNAVGESPRWRFRFRGNLDTAAVRWVRIVPADSSRSLLPWQPLELVAEAPLDSATAEIRVQDQQGAVVPIRWEVRAAQHWRLFPLRRWEAGQWYRLEVRFRSRQLPGGRRLADTLIVRHFQVLDTRQYAGISGRLLDSCGCAGPYILLLRSRQGGAGIWRQSLAQPGAWQFEELPPGLYELEAFCDEDRNGRYSAGSAFPYRFAERFARLGPLELKPRWSIEDVVIELP